MAEQQATGPWQTEPAPRDGTFILAVFSDELPAYVVCWYDPEATGHSWDADFSPDHEWYEEPLRWARINHEIESERDDD